MREIIQLLQIILFLIPVGSLWLMGVLLLLRPVNILHRRWRLLVFIPLLAANLLAVLENNLSSEGGIANSWGLWLVVGIDLVLGVGVWTASRGFLVFGLSTGELEEVLTEGCREMGMQVTANEEEETLLLGGEETVHILHIEGGQETMEIKIRNRFNEITIQVEPRAETGRLRGIFPLLKDAKVASKCRSRATGVLYLILGLVFAVLGWIFFFEPRLILLE